MNPGHHHPAKPVIRIVAAVLLDGEGRTLVVRKRGTEAFMQPGGKPAEGETDLAALSREVEEELGCRLDAGSFRPLGRFSAPAANEPGFTVEAELFAAILVGEVIPSGEIEEAIWVDPNAEVPFRLAPLSLAHAIPLARELQSPKGIK